MKRLTKVIKIIAIILNTIFLAVILFVVSRAGAHPQTAGDWAGCILLFAFPSLTLITIALTFHKRLESLTSVLKILAISVNVSFLIILIFEMVVDRVHLESPGMWLFCLMDFVLPVVNVLTIALTYRKGEAEV